MSQNKIDFDGNFLSIFVNEFHYMQCNFNLRYVFLKSSKFIVFRVKHLYIKVPKLKIYMKVDMSRKGGGGYKKHRICVKIAEKGDYLREIVMNCAMYYTCTTMYFTYLQVGIKLLGIIGKHT